MARLLRFLYTALHTHFLVSSDTWVNLSGMLGHGRVHEIIQIQKEQPSICELDWNHFVDLRGKNGLLARVDDCTNRSQ